MLWYTPRVGFSSSPCNNLHLQQWLPRIIKGSTEPRVAGGVRNEACFPCQTNNTRSSDTKLIRLWKQEATLARSGRSELTANVDPFGGYRPSLRASCTRSWWDLFAILWTNQCISVLATRSLKKMKGLFFRDQQGYIIVEIVAFVRASACWNSWADNPSIQLDFYWARSAKEGHVFLMPWPCVASGCLPANAAHFATESLPWANARCAAPRQHFFDTPDRHLLPRWPECYWRQGEMPWLEPPLSTAIWYKSSGRKWLHGRCKMLLLDDQPFPTD